MLIEEHGLDADGDGTPEQAALDGYAGRDGDWAAGFLGGKNAWHQAVIADFIAAVRHGRPPMVTRREALISQGLIAAIETSSRAGRPVELAGL